MVSFVNVGDVSPPRALSFINSAYIIHYAREWTKIERNSSPGYHILKTKRRSQFRGLPIVLKWFQKKLRACLPGGEGPQVGGVTRLYIQSLI